MNTPSSPLEPLWQHAAGQSYPQSALYVVATPIGNLSDITIRALYVLNLCDAIACEDTRHSKSLLSQYDIRKPLFAVHEHNEMEAAQNLITHLRKGERIALISDAGTPAISDPGARVVAAVRAAGLSIIPLAGASASVTAMSAAGLEGGFLFAGFLPNKSQARLNMLQTLTHVPAHLVFYEAPHRLNETIAALGQSFPDRSLTIVKELSKIHEYISVINLQNIDHWLDTAPVPRGEYVLIVSAAILHEDSKGEEWQHVLTTLLEELPLKQAVALTVKLTQIPKNKVYSTALTIKNAD